MNIKSESYLNSAKLKLHKHHIGIWYDPITHLDTYKYVNGVMQYTHRFNDLNCEYWNVYIRRGD